MRSYPKLFTAMFTVLVFALPGLFAEGCLFTRYEGSWHVVQKVINSTPYVQAGEGVKEASGELYAIKEIQPVQPAANASVEVQGLVLKLISPPPGQSPVPGNGDLVVSAMLRSKTDLTDLVIVIRLIDVSGKIDHIVRGMSDLKAGLPDTFSKSFPLGTSVLKPDSCKLEFHVFSKGIELRQTKAP